MSRTNSRVFSEGRIAFVVTLAILLVCPTEAAIARSSHEIQQLYQREGRDRSDSSDKSTESVEWHKSAVPALIIEDTQGTQVPDVDQELIPEPLPPVFDEELAMPSPRRLDVLQEAGAELPWPIGSYNLRYRGVRVTSNPEFAHEQNRHFLIPEGPDKRHRYMHSILNGYGNERNIGAFDA